MQSTGTGEHDRHGDNSGDCAGCFRPEEWDEIKRICPDLHDTYEEWQASAQEMIDTIGSQPNERVVKVILTAAELRKWQRATGRKVDGKVRSQLAAKRAGKADIEHSEPDLAPRSDAGDDG
ncbi:hypothetical protein HL667_05255 [Bradyrhizobium sp. 83012]|uniref:Terminase small subunit n=1 Tax=Bradyrhizobium aeschynomenes TaxID=2734909 RepID=A0ABX2C810_9BRAD|nr:hypothetical protein [Bradyrhizobium aeschynomenes]NPU64398.1 hypothetical protein [Bradyrhizobium aeschynomenes]